MDVSHLWKSEEEVVKEEELRKEEERKQVIRKAREENLIQDTEVLAEMVMSSMMDSMALAEQVEALKNEIEELKIKDGAK